MIALHADLNRRAAKALGKPFEGEGSSWHDIPECIEKLQADLAACRRERDERQAKADILEGERDAFRAEVKRLKALEPKS